MSEIVENLPIQIKCAQYYMMIYYYIVKCYEHTNWIVENI